MNRKNNYDHFRDNAIAGYDYRNLFELPIGNYNMKVGPERNLQSFYEIIKMLEDTKIELKHNGFKEYKNSVNNLEHNLGKLKKAAFEETYDVNDSISELIHTDIEILRTYNSIIIPNEIREFSSKYNNHLFHHNIVYPLSDIFVNSTTLSGYYTAKNSYNSRPIYIFLVLGVISGILSVLFITLPYLKKFNIKIE